MTTQAEGPATATLPLAKRVPVELRAEVEALTADLAAARQDLIDTLGKIGEALYRADKLEQVIANVQALADDLEAAQVKHLRVTARSAPDHRPCESAARAHAARLFRALLPAAPTGAQS